MWALHIFAVIGVTAIIALLAWGVSKTIDLFAKIDSIDCKYENIDDRYWNHERTIATIDDKITSIRNDISMLATRMYAAENAIQDMKKEDAANA